MDKITILKLTNKKLKALGLVEILASIAIFGGVIIVLTALTLSGYHTVKDNELIDSATAVMVNSLEFLKSSQDPGVMAMMAAAPATKYIDFVGGHATVTNTVLTTANTALCGTATMPKVNLQIPLTTPVAVMPTTDTILAAILVCNEVEVIKNADGSYNLRSILVYKIGSTFTVTELKGYRPPTVN